MTYAWPNKSLQATRDSALSLSRSRWLADVSGPACLSSGHSAALSTASKEKPMRTLSIHTTIIILSTCITLLTGCNGGKREDTKIVKNLVGAWEYTAPIVPDRFSQSDYPKYESFYFYPAVSNVAERLIHTETLALNLNRGFRFGIQFTSNSLVTLNVNGDISKGRYEVFSETTNDWQGSQYPIILALSLTNSAGKVYSERWPVRFPEGGPMLLWFFYSSKGVPQGETTPKTLLASDVVPLHRSLEETPDWLR